MTRYIRPFIFISALFIIAGCNNRKEISDLFEMEGCSGPCYQRMPCEGEKIVLEIELTGSNVLQNGQMFFVRDETDVSKTIKVEFDQSVPVEVQNQMTQNVGKTAVINGHIEGYDLLNPESCRRAHLIYVSSAEDLQFE
ncbi:MAG: hypothetical protein R3275_06745 [Saprospiraceae bacterium]|nr:hypothetical protein [Saprospiraceae bacterium]